MFAARSAAGLQQAYYNTMTDRKRTKGQTTIYKTLHIN